MRPRQRVPLPSRRPFPLREAGEREHRATVRICRAPTTVGPSAGPYPARGRNRHSYPRRASLTNNDGLRPSHLWRHNQNNALTTTPRRPSGCTSATARGCSTTTTYPMGHRATVSPPLRKCGSAFRRGFGLAGLAVGVRSYLEGLLSLSFGARGCAGEIISSETKPSPFWVLGRFRVWGGWDKCRT